jgi:radical SAM superfamily enzyme YgiQ (UPF0313 family)
MNKQLDILFIHTNSSKQIYQELSKQNSAIEPPIWAAMLANHCKINGFGVSILDCEAEQLNWEESAKIISEMNPKIACFVVYGQQPSASSQNMSGAVGTAKILKKYSNIKTLFVGAHVAALPHETLLEDSIDMICQNEGVYTISNLLKTDLSYEQIKRVKGIGYKKDGKIILNTPEKIVQQNRLEIDLPGMSWDLLPNFDKYRTSGWHSWSNNTINSPFASLYTSLGCPYKCSFCMINIINRTNNNSNICSSDNNIFRWWNPDFIIKQFDYFAESGVKNIKIADELFVLNPNHFIKLCNLIIERKYDFNIWVYSRIDTCKPKYLDILKKAGVNWLALGIENPNQQIRDQIHKNQFLDVKIKDLINNINDYGINIAGNYIFGLPTDTKETMQYTLDFAMENKTELANFYCAMAYPGSKLYLEAKEKGLKLPYKYEGYSQHSYETLNLSNENLTSAEILKFRDDAFYIYNSDESYLKMIENKFGINAKRNIEDTLKIKLKRRILGD